MFCPFGSLAHDFVIHPAHDKPWFYHVLSTSTITIQENHRIHPYTLWCDRSFGIWHDVAGVYLLTKSNPTLGNYEKTHWSLQNHGSWRPFWEGSGPYTKSRPSIFWVIHLSSMMILCPSSMGVRVWFYKQLSLQNGREKCMFWGLDSLIS